ncbi:putative tyrosine-protein phosphatase OCA1, partial [Diplonema papillatum]
GRGGGSEGAPTLALASNMAAKPPDPDDEKIDKEGARDKQSDTSEKFHPALRPLPNVIPPLRFALVEAGVYRGGHPVLFNYRFMKRLKLRTIISMLPDEPPQDLRDFCSSERIIHHFFQCDKFKETTVLMMADITQVLELILDPKNHPMYMHCLDGGHVTGSIVIALRKLQGWDNGSIYEEHFRWTADKEVTSSEESFIEEFRNPCLLRLPEEIPPWLWEGSYVDAEGNKKRNKLFAKLKYPAGLEEKPLPQETEVETIVGSMETLYSLESFLGHVRDKVASFNSQSTPGSGTEDTGHTGHQTGSSVTPLHAQPVLWEQRKGDTAVVLSRTLHSFWLDVGPAGRYVASHQHKLPHAASSYSDLCSLVHET